ncbi:MAG: TIGR04076 family protein [Chloroflexi bacterium]|nr:TIGR04076 family protein [Chloroflexota bacterium]
MQQSSPPRHKVELKIVSIKGERCPLELKVGQSWVLDSFTPSGMCGGAYCMLFPTIQVLRNGGAAPGAEGDVVRRSCPDPKGLVTFEMRALT